MENIVMVVGRNWEEIVDLLHVNYMM